MTTSTQLNQVVASLLEDLSHTTTLRVEPLTKVMQVTKGSFYWHFKNRAELLTGILEAWVSQQTQSIIDQVETAGGTPQEK